MKAFFVLLLMPCLTIAQVHMESFPAEKFERPLSYEELRELKKRSPCVRALNEKRPYATVKLAAIHGLADIMRTAYRAEYSGYVLEIDGQFIHSDAITQGDINKVNYGCFIIPFGARVAALYHSHLADPSVSKGDRESAAKWGVPTYIGTLRDGWIRRYDPQTDEVSEVGMIVARAGATFLYQELPNLN